METVAGPNQSDPKSPPSPKSVGSRDPTNSKEGSQPVPPLSKICRVSRPLQLSHFFTLAGKRGLYHRRDARLKRIERRGSLPVGDHKIKGIYTATPYTQRCFDSPKYQGTVSPKRNSVFIRHKRTVRVFFGTRHGTRAES